MKMGMLSMAVAAKQLDRLCVIRGGCSEGWAIDSDCDAPVLKAVDKSVDHGLSFKQIVPFRVVEIGRDDRGFFAVSFSHQFEEGICLLGFESQVPQLVNQEQVIVEQLFYHMVARGRATGTPCICW